ncbi:MAG: hypothetical protein KDA91_22790, partial [Planctomycetaceae bacterium]|nr:hypothetical protein [Planctomycetaceae bacterium]
MQSRITDFDCERMLDELSTCQAPFLIGVRHHSAAMARIIPQLLDEFQPERILLELPGEFSEWLPWLSHKETQGPVALAGCRDDGGDLFFYPFVDFSPEMAAIRWASAHGVPVDAFDLPIDERVPGLSRNHEEQPGEVDSPSEDAGPDRYHEATLSGAAPNSDRDLLQKLMDRHEVTDTGQLWDRLVESPAVTSAPEQIRRAGLLFGWATRWSNGPPSEYDRLREAWMRSCIQMAGEQRCAAVIGAFHAAALLPIPKLWTSRAGDPSINSKTDQSTSDRKGKIATSLIPYTFEQLDERSGYPAGIRDPMWHQRVFEAGSIEDIDHAAVDLIVGVCRELRNSGHPMNAADAKEVVRISRDLARVRRLKTPGRQEVVEAMQLCLTQGQLYGAGRAVAAALQTVFVGSRMGQLPADMPRCGLAPHIEQILKTLNLPGPESITQEKRMRLDPLRSALDRAREVVFRQLLVCRIPYAEPEDDGGFGDRESLTTVWTLKWQNSTAAMISLSSARGTTLRQAAEGILRQSLLEPQSEWGMTQLETFSQAATCGLGELVRTGLDWIHGSFSDSATLPELTKAMSLIDPIRSGHIPGLPHPNAAFRTDFCQAFAVPQSVTTSALLQAALTRLDGLIGSEQVEDARALLDLVLWFQQQDAVVSTSLEASRLLWTLRQFMDAGSGLMHGTSAAALLILNQLKKEQFQSLTASWLDAATSSESRRLLSMRLTGMLPVALPRIQSDIECLAGIDERIDAFDDNEFLQRTPALRRGFQVLSPAARRGVLRQIQDLHPECDSRTISSSGSSEVLDPATQQMWFEADQAAGQMLLSLMPDLELSDDLTQMESQSDLSV